MRLTANTSERLRWRSRIYLGKMGAHRLAQFASGIAMDCILFSPRLVFQSPKIILFITCYLEHEMLQYTLDMDASTKQIRMETASYANASLVSIHLLILSGLRSCSYKASTNFHYIKFVSALRMHRTNSSV